MTKETLNSDRINYLIWRYLVESDYPETAVRLQKEWNIPDPQQLPFAPHVQNHTLVSILNRGLLYNVQEREPILQNGGAAVEAPSTGFFGPLMPPSPAADEDFENARKRQIDNEQPQMPPAKKPRLSNGFDQGSEATAMDVDGEQNGDENAYPSPEMAPPSPAVATVGPSRGTLIEKVHELSSETVFLELSDDPSAKNALLYFCEFNPQVPTILAAAGTDALARMWTLSPTISAASGSESPGKPVLAPHTNLLHDAVPPSTTITGLAWSSDGSAIAVASQPTDDGIAKVEFWSKDGSSHATFHGFDAPIVCIRWGFHNANLLTISPRNNLKETQVSVIYPAMMDWLKYSLPIVLDTPTLDGAWIGPEEFVIGGGDFLQAFHVLDDKIHPGKKYQTREGALLSKVVYDQHSQLLATASELGIIDIWDLKSGEHRSFNAHQGVITALVWQPFHDSAANGENTERLLASAGEDGAISLWNARSADTKSKCSMTMGSGVVALAFSPDGTFIAAGTYEGVLIWKTGNVHIPRASWKRSVEAGWRTPQSHDSTTDEDQFTLSWSADGQKFAYAVNSRLAVINFKSGDDVSPDMMIS